MGYEREQRGKSAGVRTHAGCHRVSTLRPHSLQTGTSTADLTRVLQGLIAGVGFLWGRNHNFGNQTVETRGLTTAAGIWVTAAIGMAAGMGRESTAVLSTIVFLFVLSVVPWIYRAKREHKKGREGANRNCLLTLRSRRLRKNA